MKALVSKYKAFSLVEVVVAVGIFAVAIVAVIGLLAPTAKSISDTVDTAVASRLADSVAAELARVRDAQTATGTNTKLDVLAGLIPTSSSTSPLTIVALADGSYSVLESNADNDPVAPAAGTPRGIAPADRYFLIQVSRHTSGGTPADTLAYTTGSGFMALSVIVKWPYKLRTDPADSSKSLTAATGSQSSLIYNLALTL